MYQTSSNLVWGALRQFQINIELVPIYVHFSNLINAHLCTLFKSLKPLDLLQNYLEEAVQIKDII